MARTAGRRLQRRGPFAFDFAEVCVAGRDRTKLRELALVEDGLERAGSVNEAMGDGSMHGISRSNR